MTHTGRRSAAVLVLSSGCVLASCSAGPEPGSGQPVAAPATTARSSKTTASARTGATSGARSSGVGTPHRVIRAGATAEQTPAYSPTGALVAVGTTVAVVCQVEGEVLPFDSAVMDSNADQVADLALWNRLDDGRYVNDYFLDTAKPGTGGEAGEGEGGGPGRDPALPDCPR